MVERYQHPIFAQQYDLSEGSDAHLGDTDRYTNRFRDLDGTVLELAAGTGRLTLPLAAAGVRVVALDIGRPMLEILSRKAPPASPILGLVCGDMTRLPVQGPFDAVFCGYNSLSCLLKREALAVCFRGIHRLLEAGAPFLFDIAVFRDEDHSETTKQFDWMTWTTEDGRAIRRMVTARHRTEAERLECVYTYRWRDETDGVQERSVDFTLNTFPVDDVIGICEDAGFTLHSTDEKSFTGRSGRKRVWTFAEMRRR